MGGSLYGAKEVPDDDEVAEFYETAVERLAAAGIPRYEISNFARPGFESRHNLKYWRLEPYVGFGSDAHSFDGHARRGNAETPAEYIEQQAGRAQAPTPVNARPDEERFFVGLRLMAGIRPTAEEWNRFDQPIRELIGLGLLEREDGVLRLTSRGVPLSNQVFQEFIDL